MGLRPKSENVQGTTSKSVLCFEKDLYALKPNGEPLDTQIESKYLAAIDSLGAQAIRDFARKRLTPQAQRALAFFAAHQFMRLPSKRRQISDSFERLIVDSTRIAFATTERARQNLDQIAGESASADEVSPESIVEFVNSDQMRVIATEVPFLLNMIQQGEELCELLLILGWEILVSPSGKGFITCDDPLVIVPPEGVRDVGLGIPGSVKYLPLTPDLCLRMGDPDTVLAYRKIDGDAVRIINQNIAANSERFIMGPVRAQLEKVVERSGSAVLDDSPRFSIETVLQNDDEALTMFRMNPTRYFYSKDGSGKGP